ncbi:MAG TPA: protein kinase [Pyrinomonadaceae bacterium]|nr:protein kinase [Pyrinomonadaceae bacterium]
MTPERWQQVKELFNSALERDRAQRSAFLAEACRGDDYLRHEVESLLSSHERDGQFIDTPAFALAKDLLTDKHSAITVGKSLGSYRILSILGRGGMGEVYLAEDTRLGRKVALKLLPSLLAADQDRLRRFEREARAASALNHPNILTIYEISSADGRQFIATEYVEGETLRQRMVHSRFSVVEALDVAAQVASALAAAHQAGIVHRDIKPENIMLRRDGYVKVVDFGLAKLTETANIALDTSQPTAVNTETGTVMGTTAYMSPEQARALQTDARSDIWSLGVVLYEMITARVPFEGETSSHVVVSILEREPAAIASFVTDVPAEIEWIVRKTLRKDKDERYQTARELLGDLKTLKQRLEFQIHTGDTVSQDNPVVSPGRKRNSNSVSYEDHSVALLTDIDQTRPTQEEALIPGIKSHQPAIIFAALLLVVVTIFAGYKFLDLRQSVSRTMSNVAQQIQPDLKPMQLTSWSGLDLFPAFSPDGNSIAYSSDHNGNFEIYLKQLAPGGREIQLTSDGQQNFEPDWSPDGKLIAFYSRSRGGIWVVAALGGAARQLTEFGSNPHWSPDGSVIAFQSTGLTDFSPSAPAAMPPSTIWIVPATGGSPHQVTQTGNPVGGHGSPSWSPDGKRIAFAASIGNTGGIWSVANNGSDLRLLYKGNGFDPVFSSDGVSIYFAGGDPAGMSWALLRLRVSPQTGESLGEATVVKNTGSTIYKHLRASSDGKKIACSALEMKNNLSVLSIAPGSADSRKAPVVLTQDTNYRKYGPTFSPDGSKVAYSVVRIGAKDEVWLMDADGKNPTQVNTNPETGSFWPNWFPEGNRIAYCANGAYMMRAIDLKTGRDEVLFESDQSMGWPRLSPDGKQFAFNSTRSGTINVWTIPVDGGQPRQLTFDKELMGFPCWSPDGRFIAVEMKRGDDAHVAIMPVEGGAPVQLTATHGQDFVSTWSPDGTKVAFAGLRNGVWNLYWVSVKDKTEKKLTDYTKLNTYVRYPSWSPLGDKIVYEYSETTGNIWLMELN